MVCEASLVTLRDELLETLASRVGEGVILGETLEDADTVCDSDSDSVSEKDRMTVLVAVTFNVCDPVLTLVRILVAVRVPVSVNSSVDEAVGVWDRVDEALPPSLEGDTDGLRDVVIDDDASSVGVRDAVGVPVLVVDGEDELLGLMERLPAV